MTSSCDGIIMTKVVLLISLVCVLTMIPVVSLVANKMDLFLLPHKSGVFLSGVSFFQGFFLPVSFLLLLFFWLSSELDNFHDKSARH